MVAMTFVVQRSDAVLRHARLCALLVEQLLLCSLGVGLNPPVSLCAASSASMPSHAVLSGSQSKPMLSRSLATTFDGMLYANTHCVETGA